MLDTCIANTNMMASDGFTNCNAPKAEDENERKDWVVYRLRTCTHRCLLRHTASSLHTFGSLLQSPGRKHVVDKPRSYYLSLGMHTAVLPEPDIGGSSKIYRSNC